MCNNVLFRAHDSHEPLGRRARLAHLPCFLTTYRRKPMQLISTIRPQWAYLFSLLLLLTGCSAKPPECSDSAAVKELHSFMDAAILEGLRYQRIEPAEDKRGVIQKYLASWKFDVSNISTQGYNEAARTRSCSAKVAVTVPGAKQSGEVQVQYDLQKYEDSKAGDFELRASRNFKAWSQDASSVVANHYRIYGVAGSWSGVAQCDPTSVRPRDSLQDLPMAELAQGYSVLKTSAPWVPDEATRYPISATIGDGQVVMVIAKPDGSKVTRKGAMKPSSRLEVSNDDELATAVLAHGYISDDKILTSTPNFLTVDARVKSNTTGSEFDARLVRYCGLELKREK